MQATTSASYLFLMAITALVGCSRGPVSSRSDDRVSKKLTHYGITVPMNFGTLYERYKEENWIFEKSFQSLPKYDLGRLETDKTSLYVLVSDYPSVGDISEFQLLKDPVLIRIIDGPEARLGRIRISDQTEDFTGDRISRKEFAKMFDTYDVRTTGTGPRFRFEHPWGRPQIATGDTFQAKVVFWDGEEQDIFHLSVFKGQVVSVSYERYRSPLMD